MWAGNEFQAPDTASFEADRPMRYEKTFVAERQMITMYELSCDKPMCFILCYYAMFHHSAFDCDNI